MLQLEHSAILSTFFKLPFINKIFVLSIFEWPFYTGFTVCLNSLISLSKNIRASNFHIEYFEDPNEPAFIIMNAGSPEPLEVDESWDQILDLYSPTG